MKYNITPDCKDAFLAKVAKMTKNWAVKPVVEFSDIKEGIQGYAYRDADSCDSQMEVVKWKVTYIEVEISEVKAGEWVLVGSVDYKEDIVTICDAKRFKDIPKHMGLDYRTCDHCGKQNLSTNAYILYNELTGEWKQVGSTCINKLVNGGKYLSNFFQRLGIIVINMGGCEEGGFGGWKVSEKWRAQAVSIKTAFETALYSYTEESKVWKKDEYSDDRRPRLIAEGTNKHLMDICGSKTIKDEALFAKVSEYAKSLEGRVDEYGEPDFNGKMKAAFENEYIALYEMYLAWFAIKKYNDSLIHDDFGDLLSEYGIAEGETITIHCEDMAYNMVETMYGDILECTLIDKTTGLTFTKSVSHNGVFDKYRTEDGSYRFKADIKRVYRKSHKIILGGRLKKA